MDINDSSVIRDSDGFVRLKRSYSELFSKRDYKPHISIVINRIYEYDIKSSNTSVLKNSRKMKISTLNELEALPKEQRNIAIGLMIAKNKDIQRILDKGVIRAKRQLFEANGIQSNEVLTIKNDAVFIIGRKLRVRKFGAVEFTLRNAFSLYMGIEGLEFYYDAKRNSIVVKGLSDDIVESEDHQNGMVQFFSKVFELLIYDRKQDLRDYLISFSCDYKSRKLSKYYYKEFNSQNLYRMNFNLPGFEYNLFDISEDDKDSVNIAYNYNRFILPIIRQYI